MDFRLDEVDGIYGHSGMSATRRGRKAGDVQMTAQLRMPAVDPHAKVLTIGGTTAALVEMMYCALSYSEK